MVERADKVLGAFQKAWTTKDGAGDTVETGALSATGLLLDCRRLALTLMIQRRPVHQPSRPSAETSLA
jgi:hypothetical protein